MCPNNLLIKKHLKATEFLIKEKKKFCYEKNLLCILRPLGIGSGVGSEYVRVGKYLQATGASKNKKHVHNMRNARNDRPSFNLNLLS